MARKRTGSTAALRFRGAPRALEALAPGELDLPLQGTLVLEGEGSKQGTTLAPVTLQTEAAGGDATWLRFDLPDTTPPGTYIGRVQVGRKRYPVSIEVTPLADLDVSPSRLVLAVAPGGQETVELTLVNNGNVPVAIESVYAFNLLEDGAIEEAVHSALREQSAGGEKLIHRFAEELAGRHGGLVRVAVKNAGPVEPGKTREIQAVLRFGKDLRRGAKYTTTWSIGNLNIWIEVVVEAATRRRSRKETA
jgi:hypothetical protein